MPWSPSMAAREYWKLAFHMERKLVLLDLLHLPPPSCTSCDLFIYIHTEVSAQRLLKGMVNQIGSLAQAMAYLKISEGTKR